MNAPSPVLTGLLLLITCGGLLCAAEPVMLYAAPQAQGTGDARSPENAAAFRAPAFWKQVNTLLQEAPVTVRLAAGKYLTTYPGDRTSSVSISRVGHPENRLTIQGAPDGGSVFSRDPGDNLDPTDRNNWPNLITFRNSQNVTVENLHFTGKGVVGYAIQFRDTPNVTVRHCQWKDMPNLIFGASGANGQGCRNVTWEDNVFDTIGYDSHAHMLYNANHCTGLTVRRNFFRDCAGDYVRFRNNINDIVVEDNRFEDTGHYPGAPFVSMPLFVDYDEPAHYEYFSQKFALRNNLFEYHKPSPRSMMLLYHHSGYNPPGKSYLIHDKEAKAFQKMSVEEARRFLSERLGFDPSTMEISGNRTKGCRRNIVYESRPQYGSEKQFPEKEYSNDLILDRCFIIQ